MQISARNQLKGTVTSVTLGTVMAEVAVLTSAARRSCRRSHGRAPSSSSSPRDRRSPSSSRRPRSCSPARAASQPSGTRRVAVALKEATTVSPRSSASWSADSVVTSATRVRFRTRTRLPRRHERGDRRRRRGSAPSRRPLLTGNRDLPGVDDERRRGRYPGSTETRSFPSSRRDLGQAVRPRAVC